MYSRIKHIFEEVQAFFPLQLLINNFKKNQILLIFWLVLYAVITHNFGKKLGIPYLFLDPEYQNEVSAQAMFIIGVCFGIFSISYFITSYILDSHRFPFLVTLKYPFVSFCINNSILPLSFISIYIFKFFEFQTQSGFQEITQIITHALAFVAGTFITIFLILSYFKYTNRKHVRIIVSKVDFGLRKRRINAVKIMDRLKNKKLYKINSFISSRLWFNKVNQDYHVEKSELIKIIDQHHLNAVSVEIFVFISIIVTGIFSDYPAFQIPAAASGLLLFSFFIMFTGAFSYWLRGWAISGIIILVVFINILVKNNILSSNNQAYGINYETEYADYSLEKIREVSQKKYIEEDIVSTTKILENWRKKFPVDEKPKMILISSSGGGQRSATWTLNALQTIDRVSNGQLMKNTVLMTGASGGLIGLSYYRELYLRKKLGLINNLSDEKFMNNISKDILNPMVFSMVASDLFLRFQKFNIDNYSYYKDRGYAFEKQLSKNTDNVLDKKLIEYKTFEQSADIPLLFIVPTIINDARRLFISPQKISYMNIYSHDKAERSYPKRIRGVEFSRMFENQDADNLTFLSALRMSATFPYITPNVKLPSNPEMEIMDAGLSDNFGVKDVIHFLYTFQDWIEENTSGVILLTIRDKAKDPEVEKHSPPSVWNKLFNPIGGLVNNWEHIQDFSNDNRIEFAKEWFEGDLDFINIIYDPRPTDYINHDIDVQKINKLEKTYKWERAALSWHLTKREKEGIKNYIYDDNNKENIQELLKLLQ